MQRYFDVVQNRQGTAVVGATVTVYDANGSPATLYSNNSGTAPTSNPVYTNADGEYAFYAANGTYTIQIAATGYAGETKPGVVLFDPKDAGIISVKDFGAKGDGVSDDTAAIQAAVNSASLTGLNVIFPSGTYNISSTIIVKPNADLPEEGSGSSLHFSQSNPVGLFSDSQAVLKATASMTIMVKYTFDATDSDIAPFYSRIENMSFDGNSVATDCLYMDYSMHMHVEGCRFWNYTGAGIRNFGYGVAQYFNNVFRGSKGIFIERGGDTLVEHNDFFLPTNGIGIDCGYFSGNTNLFSNIFTKDGSGTLIGIRLSGDYAATSNEEVRHIVILGNEFCGLSVGVYSQAFGTNARNVYQCAIITNHVTPFDATNVGCLADLNSSEGIIVQGNWINKEGFSQTTGVSAVNIFNCFGVSVDNNIFENLGQEAIRLNDAKRCRVTNNYFYDCGKLGQSYVVVNLFNTSEYNLFQNNYFYCSTPANFAQNGLYEQSGPNYNTAKNNQFVGFATPYYKTGANTWFWRQEPGAAMPTTGQYHKSDVVINTSPSVFGSGGSQYVIKEWLRLTDGVNNVLNIDWIEARVLTGT